jgi:hypothetical protein
MRQVAKQSLCGSRLFLPHILFIALLSVACADASDQGAPASPKRVSQLARKIEFYSAQLLGRPYVPDPLGEGEGYDSDPLYRFDAFDCTTYVETVLSLAYADGDVQKFAEYMDLIRYKNGRPAFVERNHFPSVDWIPNNIAKGFFLDITADLGPTAISQATIDRRAWFEKVHGLLIREEPVLASLAYVPREVLLNDHHVEARVPSGVVVNFLRDSRRFYQQIGTEVDVQHQGLLVRKADGQLYLRHARNKKYGVLEEPFLKFARAQKEFYGLHFLQPKEPRESFE